MFRIEDWLIRNHKLIAAKELQNIGVAPSYTLDMLETDGMTAATNFEQLVETLTFTTKINAGVMPSVMLMPVGRAIQLTSASLDFEWSRRDKHEVIVGLGMPTVPPLEGHAKRLYSTISSARGIAARARTPLLIDASVPADAGPSSGVALALEAVNNQIVRFEALRPTVVVAP